MDSDPACPVCGGPMPSDWVTVSLEENMVARPDGRWVRVTPHLAELAYILASAGGRVVRHSALFDALYGSWGRDPPADRMILVHACRLRKQIRPLGLDVESEWGVGYKLVDKEKS